MDYLSENITGADGVAPRPIILLLFELQSLRERLSWLAREWQGKMDLPYSLKGRRPRELEWLAGVALPLVYERHFLHRAGRSRNAAGEVSGPTIRFIQATLNEVGILYSEESIARAFSRLTALRNERRAKTEGTE
jgi:hypothetical protein